MATLCPDIFCQILSHRSSSVPLDRRIPHWLGRAHSTPPSISHLGDLTGKFSYQSTRNSRSLAKHPQPQSQRKTSQYLHRQSNSPVCHQQGPKPVHKSPVRNRGSLLRSTQPKPHSQSVPNLDTPQHKGGFSKQRPSDTFGNIYASCNFPKNCSLERPSLNGSNGRQYQATSVCEPSSGPSRSRAQCLGSQLEPVVPDLLVSILMVHSSHTRKVGGLQGTWGDNPPVAPIREMVSKINETNCECITPGEQLDWLPLLRNTNCLQLLEEVLSFKKGPKVAKQLLQVFWVSSHRQSQSVWKTFQSRLDPNVRAISSPLILEFLIFLSESKHLGPRTILNYKGCLPWPLREAFGMDLNSNDFTLLARSLFHQRPPKPKKVLRWSINTALNTYQSDRFKLQLASQEDLFLKTLFLTALASGNRASELAATIREGIQFDQPSITLPVAPTFLFKNQSLNNPTPPPIEFPSLPSNRDLCPASFLPKYIQDTQNLPHKGFIFIHPKTKAPLKAGRLSYWLARAIETGDPVGGSVHDLRKVGFSCAFARGQDLTKIIKNISWQSSNVFIRAYLVNTLSLPQTHFVGGRT